MKCRNEVRVFFTVNQIRELLEEIGILARGVESWWVLRLKGGRFSDFLLVTLSRAFEELATVCLSVFLP